MLQLIAISGAAIGVLGAILGLRAATVQVRDNVDEFVGDLQKQGRWASYAATAAAIATTIGALEKFVG